MDFKIQTGKTILQKDQDQFIIDETQNKVGSELIWLWVAIRYESNGITGINISKERNMFVAERFILKVVVGHGEHPVSTDGGT